MSLIHFNHLPNLINHIHKLIILICFLNLEFNQINSLPLNNQINNLEENNQLNFNPLNQYLKEPEIVKIYKEKIVIKIFPLNKKDVQVNNYYVIVESIDEKLNPFINNSTINLNNLEDTDFSLNYYNSLRKGRSFYAAVKLTGQVFYGRRTYVTIIIGKHQVDLSRPREFRLEDYVNPFLICGKHYRIGIAAELKTNNRKKEFIYVPYSRTIIMGENGNGQCEQIDTVALFFALSFIALIVSLVSFCILLFYNTISTGNLYFWKKKKMNCKQLMKQNSNNKERLTLINHTNIYEEDDYNGDYDGIEILSKAKAKNLDSKTNSIPISILYEYYNQMNSDHLFKKEYDSVPKGKLFNSKIATLKINQKKNRYLNLLPYDNNRVILDALPNEINFIESKSFNLKGFKKDELDKLYLRPTDYINASYIDVYDYNGELIPKKYIATQGPLKHTIADFWKMVYQTNCNQIVMLANVFEGGQIKCEKYWPEFGTTQIYGQLCVKCREEFNYADYTIRIFRIKESNDDIDSLNNNNESFKDVTHYHFTQWGDHSVPEYSDSIALLLNSIRTHWSYKNQNLNLNKNNDSNKSIKKMNSIVDEFELEDKQKLNSSPIIVHCSAGIGRSGCFMVIDSLLEQAIRIRENNGDFENYKIDVLKEFANIRKQRIQSIERISQYAFVHQVLVEMLSSRDIYDVEPKDYTKYYKFLKESSIKKLNEFKNISKLEEQFNILNKFKIQIDDDLKSVGMFNLKKNRNRQSIPKNTTRVLLPIVSDDYINAVYLNGFKYLNEFIVTEVPLKDVRHSFWLMVNNENIDTIVLLNSIESHNIYWPTELNNPHVYKELEIELICEEKTTDYFVRRQFRINKKKLIYQLHYNHWESICKRPSNLASYCLFMKSVQTHLNKNSSFPNQFIVQCLNGVTASGIYCISKHILDRLFSENRINVFLSSKYLRTNRMEFIECMEQYNFIYEYIQLITLSFFSKDYKFLNFSMNN